MYEISCVQSCAAFFSKGKLIPAALRPAELIVLFAVAQEARSIDCRGKLEIYARQRARGGVCKQYPRSDAKQLNFHRSAAHSPSNLVFLSLSRAGARSPRSRFIFRVQ